MKRLFCVLFNLKMSDGRKRLSGSEYRKRAKLKTKEQEQVLNKTLKIENFFKSGNVLEPNFPRCSTSSDTILNVETEDMVLSEHNQEENVQVMHEDDKNRQDKDESFDTTAVQESIQKHVEEDTVSSMDVVNPHDGIFTTKEVVEGGLLSKDPALWVLNDNARDIVAKQGFDQNNTGDFEASKRTYSDHNRFFIKITFQPET